MEYSYSILNISKDYYCYAVHSQLGVSNHWNGIWNGTIEWKMEWNTEHTQLQLTRVTGAAQFWLNYLVYL